MNYATNWSTIFHTLQIRLLVTTVYFYGNIPLGKKFASSTKVIAETEGLFCRHRQIFFFFHSIGTLETDVEWVVLFNLPFVYSLLVQCHHAVTSASAALPLNFIAFAFFEHTQNIRTIHSKLDHFISIQRMLLLCSECLTWFAFFI